MDDILASAALAVELEKKAHDEYIKAARRTKNRLGASTLEALAAKEIEHMRAIEQFIKTEKEGSTDLSGAIAKIRADEKGTYIAKILKSLADSVSAPVKEDKELEAAYRAAMKLEEGSYDLYKRLASGAGGESKKFFEFLMGQENIHFELLQETLQYLNDPAEWFKKEERWIVEG